MSELLTAVGFLTLLALCVAALLVVPVIRAARARLRLAEEARLAQVQLHHATVVALRRLLDEARRSG